MQHLEAQIPDEATPHRSRRRGWGVLRILREFVESVALALLLFFLLETTVQNTRVDGYSMEPNLYDKQYLIVNKVVYRLRPPERGDVVVFRFPDDPQQEFIKRIIGLPGEQVEIREGQVYINDQLLEEQYYVNAGSYSWGPATVGAGEYFVLGDNRAQSNDSHTWGMLPVENIVGKAWISLWPPQQWGFVPSFSFSSRTEEGG